MNDSDIILDFDGNLQGYSGNKEVLDLDIEATATPLNISMQFQDNKNDTTYYAQIPVQELDDDSMLDKVISLDSDMGNQVDFIEVLETDYPETRTLVLEKLQQEVQDKLDTINKKLPYLSEVASFPIVKNTISEKKKSSRKRDKKNKKKKSRKVR